MIFCVTSLFAQLPTGTILGVVRDATGAVLPGVSVTLRHADTGTTRSLVTDETGSYRAPALPVGRYDITVELSGFNTIVQRGIELSVTQELVTNFTLQVGATTQQVEVTAEAVQVNTTSATLGGTVSETKITELPLNGRNFIDLTMLQTGVTQQSNPGGGSVGTGGTSYSSNGAPIRSNAFLLDGAMMTNAWGATFGSIANTTLGVEGIKEYRVVTNAFSAEYGMNMGSQMTIVSKGGTNQWHGSLFHFLRNDVLDARNYFAPSPKILGRRNPGFKRNNFGGSFGGPIQKDKTFFFLTYEGLRERLGTSNRHPTLGAGCRGPVGAVITNVACPQLGTTPSVTIGSNTPLIAQFLPLWPLPNLQPGDIYAFAFSQPTRVDYGQIRVDHNFSDKNTAFIRYTIDDGDLVRTRSLLAYVDPQSTRNQFLTMSHSHVFSPTLLNTARLSGSRAFIRANTESRWADRGVQPIPFLPGRPTLGGLSATGINAINPDCCSPARLPQNVLTFSDDIFFVRGRNAFKTGTLINHFDAMYELGSGNGSITFASVADLLRGNPRTYSGILPGGVRNVYYTWNTFGFYVQDDVRASSKVTLNLGLRYEFITTLHDRNGNSAAIRNVATDPTFTFGPPFKNPSLKNFSPRVGIAWDVFGNGKTAIRGGGGLLYDIATFGSAIGNMVNSLIPRGAGFSTTNVSPNGSFTIPLTVNPADSVVSGPSFVWEAHQPRLLQYNVSIEQQLPWSSVLTVAYAGSRGRNLFSGREGNPIAESARGFVTNGIGCDGTPVPSYIPNGYPCYKPITANRCASLTGAGSCRVNPNFGGLRLNDGFSKSWYDSLQVGFDKRLTQGLQFQSSYTFSKTLDTIQGQGVNEGSGNAGANNLIIPYDPDPFFSTKGPAAYDARHNWRFNALYRIPNSIQSENALGKILNGWWVSTIFAVQSGTPFTPLLANNRSTYGAGGGGMDRPEYVRAEQAGAPCPTLVNPNVRFEAFDRDRVITGNPNQWFNPCMFMPTQMGHISTVGRGILMGPNFRNVDFSLNKDIRVGFLGEQGNVQFRAEIFNLFNHPNFDFPDPSTFAGTGPAIGGPTQAPLTTAGLITRTRNTARQIQFGLRIGW